MCFLRRKILAGLEREYGGLVEAKSNCHFSQSDFQIITLWRAGPEPIPLVLSRDVF